MSALLRVASWLLALVGAGLAYAVVAGRLPPELARRSLPAQAATGHACAACGGRHTRDGHGAGDACCGSHESALPAAALLAPTTPRAVPRTRFAVCEREEARVSWSELRLRDDGPPLLAIGCGSSLHVIGFERIGDAIEPRRLLEAQVTPHSPAEAPHAVHALAADVDGDGVRDLVLTVLLADAGGSPRGGALYVARQRADGGFDAARQVLELAPQAVAAGKLDSARGEDLVLLHAGDERLARSSALWLVTGGVSPVRAAVREASVGSRAVATCDLDGDGLDEVIDAGGEDAKLRLWPSGVLAAEPSLIVDAHHVRELWCMRDAEHTHALVVAGDRLALLRGEPGSQPALQAVADAQVRSVYALDVDGDGREELVGYVHPEVLAFAPRGGGFDRRTLARLTGEGSVLDARLVTLDGAPAPEVIALIAGASTVEIAVLGSAAFENALALPTESARLPSTALLQVVALR